jgi:hypothetical protein
MSKFFMRLSREDLFKITHLHRPKSQAAWFLRFLKVRVPCDSEGPILTASSYEAILAKRLGVAPETVTPPRAVVIEMKQPRKIS